MNSSPVKDTIRNVKGIPSSRRKVIPEGNMNLYKEMNRTGNGNCLATWERPWFLLKPELSLLYKNKRTIKGKVKNYSKYASILKNQTAI